MLTIIPGGFRAAIAALLSFRIGRLRCEAKACAGIAFAADNDGIADVGYEVVAPMIERQRDAA